ncbi:MAG: hypothetical protein UT24_C0009G0054 [Candidatus Woesebacteria bacterium GW2011_GWB1_39_12]|uniref:VOC domain-containing protein n=2 Tax=Candidatus Woeseibacteriota TaxID=1752722 RepID=A0A0G0PK89_9BACT|nr:MAG: hypothetical protein UT23_C0002G0054 [Candidatus Woesebacteria bacterium GW2011_GWA1_39_12]KKR00737.1 MAG: hypothetical protein UT24_C0009G0054 [Candidatus Woesebacteria bacterium GW2011_GWB1_39_12]
MLKGLESVVLGSANAKKLASFYKDVVGLKLTLEAEMGENNENLFAFEVKGSSGFYIMDHSKVKGEAKDPNRILLNFEVDDIDKEVKKLDGKKVKKIQDKYHLEGYGWIVTYEDPDGNYFQLVQVRA